MAIDPEDNVWITAAGTSTVTKLSPDGKVLLTIGERNRRGDWDEAKGQRLLWEPVMVAFAPNGDVYIAEGHANESPNDSDSDDPANNIGAARIIMSTITQVQNQWFATRSGRANSPRRMVAVDPKTAMFGRATREYASSLQHEGKSS